MLEKLLLQRRGQTTLRKTAQCNVNTVSAYIYSQKASYCKYVCLSLCCVSFSSDRSFCLQIHGSFHSELIVRWRTNGCLHNQATLTNRRTHTSTGLTVDQHNMTREYYKSAHGKGPLPQRGTHACVSKDTC